MCEFAADVIDLGSMAEARFPRLLRRIGMIVGENSRENDMNINVCKNKKLTNVRAAGSDEALSLIPPRKLSLEDALEYIGDDELVEITPKTIRIRKKILDPSFRK